MTTRPMLAALGGAVLLLGFARSATAQPAYAYSFPYAPENLAYYERNLGGQIYYYDRAGNPLYYDDYVHYNYPRRFLYRDGGWVLLSRGREYYSRYTGAGYGVHRGAGYRGYSGAHYGRYSPRHYDGYSTRHSGGYTTGHRGSYAGGHAGTRGGGHYGGGRGHR